MQITIDTTVDSPEDIRKLIKLLSALIGESNSPSSEPSSPESLAKMFGSTEPSQSEQQQVRNQEISINELLGQPENDKKGTRDDDDMRVIPY
jgi:hypothetical protein